jgi:TolA-binding protein
MNKLIKRSVIVVAALLQCVCVQAAEQSAEQAANDIVVKTETQSVFKGVLYKVWGRLRALNPGSVNPATRRGVATAGIRGAETTTSLISPYWKDDRTEDPQYIKELTQYTKAQQLAEGGDLKSAIDAFDAFLKTHKDSDLKPNAQFALGISYGGMGDKSASVATLQTFINDNPNHPLVTDAQQVIAEMK